MTVLNSFVSLPGFDTMGWRAKGGWRSCETVGNGGDGTHCSLHEHLCLTGLKILHPMCVCCVCGRTMKMNTTNCLPLLAVDDKISKLGVCRAWHITHITNNTDYDDDGLSATSVCVCKWLISVSITTETKTKILYNHDTYTWRRHWSRRVYAAHW